MVNVDAGFNIVPDSAKLSSETLRDTLDDLLERYLNLLHEYQLLQHNLTKTMSSGFFSLARANFTNPNRIRYGQDFYDDRMQASIRFNVADQTEGTSSPGQFEQSARDIISVSTLQPMSKGTESKQAKDDERLESVEKAAELKASTLDPLLWFGVLVPPTIKASQSSFRDAVTTTIPSLANVSKEMKDLEIEIRRTRKKITKAG